MLGEACADKNVAPETLLNELAAEAAGPSGALANPAELSVHELCAYIVETHHGYLRRELPRLRSMAQRVAQVHGGHTPALLDVLAIYVAMDDELTSHMVNARSCPWMARSPACSTSTTMRARHWSACAN